MEGASLRKFFQRHSIPQAVRGSLRVKVTLVIIIPMILMLAAFLIYEDTRHRAIMLDTLSNMAAYNGQVLEESLTHSMQITDFANVQRTIDSVGQDARFRAVYLLDSSGRVKFAPGGRGAGALLDNHDASCQPCHSLAPDQRPSGVVVLAKDKQEVFRSMKPIENSPACAQCHDPGQKLLGVLLIDISVKPFEARIDREMRENLLLGIAGMLISAIIVNLGLERLVIRPLTGVAGALSSFGGGDRAVRLAAATSDEIGRLAGDFNAMVQQIQSEETENQALSEDLRQRAVQQQLLLNQLITAQEDERKRVARELHDELGQSMSGFSLHCEVMAKFIRTNPERALEELKLNRDLIGATTQQMYELILDLRPSLLDDLGLAAALHSLGERATQGSGIAFTLDSSALTRRLPPSIETALYRIFQEALTNVVKHSQASQVKVRLALRDGRFVGEIADDGQGFDPAATRVDASSPRGLGLMGMRERVSQCGGSMEIVSAPGQGARISVLIPLEEAGDE